MMRRWRKSSERPLWIAGSSETPHRPHCSRLELFHPDQKPLAHQKPFQTQITLYVRSLLTQGDQRQIQQSSKHQKPYQTKAPHIRRPLTSEASSHQKSFRTRSPFTSKKPLHVIPAKAGIQSFLALMAPRLRRVDGTGQHTIRSINNIATAPHLRNKAQMRTHHNLTGRAGTCFFP